VFNYLYLKEAICILWVVQYTTDWRHNITSSFYHITTGLSMTDRWHDAST